MKFILNYLCVLLYYTIGFVISLKYLLLYVIQLCGGGSSVKDVTPEETEAKDVYKQLKFDFHEERLNINDEVSGIVISS